VVSQTSSYLPSPTSTRVAQVLVFGMAAFAVVHSLSRVPRNGLNATVIFWGWGFSLSDRFIGSEIERGAGHFSLEAIASLRAGLHSSTIPQCFVRVLTDWCFWLGAGTSALPVRGRSPNTFGPEIRRHQLGLVSISAQRVVGSIFGGSGGSVLKDGDGAADNRCSLSSIASTLVDRPRRDAQLLQGRCGRHQSEKSHPHRTKSFGRA